MYFTYYLLLKHKQYIFIYLTTLFMYTNGGTLQYKRTSINFECMSVPYCILVQGYNNLFPTFKQILILIYYHLRVRSQRNLQRVKLKAYVDCLMAYHC